MTREEAKHIVMIISATYPNWKPLELTFTVNAWATMFEEYDYKSIEVALKAYITGDTSGFAPSPGQLIDKFHALSNPVEMNELEAWSLVYKAICNAGYSAEKEFAKLPECCQLAVGNPSNLKEWATMDIDTVQSVEQSHFIRNYRAAVHRTKEERKMPDSIKMLIQENRPQKKMEYKNVEEIEGKKEKNGIPFPERLREKYFKLFKN